MTIKKPSSKELVAIYSTSQDWRTDDPIRFETREWCHEQKRLGRGMFVNHGSQFGLMGEWFSPVVQEEKGSDSDETAASITASEAMVNALGIIEPRSHIVVRVQRKVRNWTKVGDRKNPLPTNDNFKAASEE
jgi:hypothetical protein